MFRVALLPTRPLGLCGLGLIAAFAGAPPVLAADIDDEPPPYTRRYDPPPVYREYDPPPVVRRWSEREAGPCRIVHRRGWDVDGREIVRRIRVCDEGVVASRSDWERRRYGHGEPRYRYEDPRYDGPRYEAAPRPPRPVGPDYRRGDYGDDLD